MPDTSSDAAPRDAPHRGERCAGFSIVEIVVAVILLAFGVLGLAGTTIWVVRQTTLGEVTMERTIALQTSIERLRALPYDAIVGGSATEGRFTVSWSVSAESRSKLVEFVTTGPGLASGASGPPQLQQAVADTFVYRFYDEN
ncbi:MAG: hypothetical protein RQ745_01705 [Longimicrobiales bacterium]|nr:hypothetical protein [Longimicrobiales bacterium]